MNVNAASASPLITANIALSCPPAFNQVTSFSGSIPLSANKLAGQTNPEVEVNDEIAIVFPAKSLN